MITTGPYSLAAGTALTVYDPAKYISASASVQVQNDSGFSLIVSVGGLALPVPPRTITTIQTGTSPQLIVQPSSVSGSSSSGSLTLLWMLAGETSPVSDGPITISTTLSAIVSFSSQSVNNTVTTQTLITLGAPTPKSQTVNLTVESSSSGGGSFSIVGGTSGHVFYSGTIGVSTTLPLTIAFTDAYGDTTLALSATTGVASFVTPTSSPYVETSQVTPTTSSISVIYQILTSQSGYSGCLVDSLGSVLAGSTFDLGQTPGAYSVTIAITSVTDQLALQVWGAGVGTDWKVLAVSSVG